MKLQADPTVCFCWDYKLDRVLKKHLTIDSPYNTYKYAGLPPAPINVPPKACIDAVLNPDKHGYIYFCASENFDGTHRFAVSYTEHLKNMGANIEYDERRALLQIFGVSELHGATVKAPDLRAGAALILAGLAATGTTTVTNVELVERGYDHIIEKLLSLGADIKKERF
jgi:hypothetical protein